ncbi:23S rRNA pseudouridine(1911/1915/1917) synthase RluD [Azospira inquinata]|uniref:Pseudouridine synthase n=1 Tax=Azospira inquinata TaxID=2785627 RepID=A0A975SMV4_9RHOO|nr:23S rRNA pseudouridine(1911/1915/1917) synthase RluD [Azospira inquinata]QWT49240.1 23S rRNA pseudouridine(1911/1915/1917) synthase RluD [Azospira inquinata]
MMKSPNTKTENFQAQDADSGDDWDDEDGQGAPSLATNGADYNPKPPRLLEVPLGEGGQRLDQVLARLVPEYSRNRLQSWIKAGQVRLDGQEVREPRYKLRGGEALVVEEGPDERQTALQPEPIPLDVVYEDQTLMVINKPAGLVVHPGSGNWSGTLLNALLYHDPRLANVPRAGIVHRLDKDTSGLLVVAKTLAAQTDLVRQLQARTVKREYLALAQGVLDRGGVVDAPIGRHPTQRTRMAVVANGRPARTHFRIVERFPRCTLVECSLETGRTHQIRVHLASLGHPLVGDPVYARGRNGGAPAFPRQALHARRLGLIHPDTRAPMVWKVPLPEDMAELLAGLRAEVAAQWAPEEDEDYDDDL